MLHDDSHMRLETRADGSAAEVERALRRTTRALKTLSATSRALVRADEETQLFHDVCRAAIDEGGYRMAWVGIALDDTNRSVQPVVAVGENTDYLYEGRFSWGDDDYATGTSGRAIRLGETVSTPDMAVDPLYSRWREGALTRGYRSIIALPLFDSHRRTFGALVLAASETDAFDAEEVALLEDVAEEVSYGVTRLQDAAAKAEVEQALFESNRRLSDLVVSITDAVGKLTEARDPYTQGHQERVSNIATAIAVHMGLDADTLRTVELAALVHDVGKLHVPAEILTKPARLTKLEFELMKQHPQKGYEMLCDIPFPWPLAEVSRCHHERMDGSGYPRGLAGADIPLEARILAVADVLEAMASHRPYRPGLGIDVALDELTTANPGKYDSRVVSACLALYAGGALEPLLEDRYAPLTPSRAAR